MTSPPENQSSRLYFDDLKVGQRFTSPASYTIDAEQIRAFAAQFDPQPFHLDESAGRATVFGGLVASGWHTAALTMRLVVQSGPPLAGGTVGLGAELSWHEPVRPGDTLHVRAEVIEAIPSRSRPDRGRVVMRTETLNQHGTVVQTCISKVLVPRRAQPAGS
ncbi:MAG TPA: MaoC family dehydratase [Steroidobacteraceae bacterium]|nr:MaoC family dehydratase [Steroidobacteraceae bacterium]